MLRVTIPLSLFARVVRVADDGRLEERPPLWRLVAAPDRHGSLCPDFGVRPCGWATSSWRFDPLLGVLVLELHRAEIAEC
jgi:hypothetical protein